MAQPTGQARRNHGGIHGLFSFSCRAMAGHAPAMVLNRMRVLLRLACLGLLLAGSAALAQAVPQPQRPFGQLVDLWTRQLDRIAIRTGQANLLPVEIDSLREQAVDVR